MFSYILKRILVFIPTFFVISLMIFGLSKLAPGDPVELLLKGGASAGNSGQRADLMSSERAYQEKAAELGLDRPTFYFSLTSAAYPADLYLIKKQNHRETISRLIDKYGNSEAVKGYYDALRAFELAASDVVIKASFETRRDMRDAFGDIYFKYEEVDIKNELKKMREAVAKDATAAVLAPKLDSLVATYQYILDNPKIGALYTPTIHGYGLNNQYHTWMFGDYPWFRKVDTMPKFKADKLNAQLNELTKLEDSLGIKAKALATNLEEMRAQIDLLADDEIDKDSIRALQTKAMADSVVMIGTLAKVKDDYLLVKAERDTIAKSIVTYASKGFLRLDFGKSYRDGGAVGEKILQALFWTVIMNFISIFLSYIISIPLGVQSAVWKKNSLQFFNVFSYHALITTAIYSISMVLYAKGVIGASWHFWILVACITGFVVFDLIMQRKYLAEAASKISPKKLKIGISSFLILALILIVNFFVELYIFNFFILATVIISIITLRQLIWAITYLLSLGMVLFWTYIIGEMLLFGAAILFIKSPMILAYIAVPIALFYAWRKYRSRQQPIQEDKTKKLWDDGKGNVQFGATGIQLRGNVLDNISTGMLFVLYSLPSFWIGTILLVFLTVASYGISWFPTAGAYTMELHQNPNTSNYTYVIDVLHHLVLPVFCMTYGSFAFLSRQTRGSMLGVLRQDYIRTANAKGLAEDKVIWKHAFRNSLFPIITLFSSVFPRALSGSIAIEMIYNIPGMGVLALSSITARDWPLVFAISMLAALLTMIGNLVADMLYGVADPRVTFK